MPFFRAFPYALRALLRAPVFSAVVILILVLGIAANTTIFALVDELLLNPFPYRDPQQLVMVWQSNPALGGITAKRVPAASVDFDAWRAQNNSFEAMEAFQINVRFNLTGRNIPEHLNAARATPGFFQMLGESPVLGRAFVSGDDAPGANPIVILTYTFWNNHFGGNSPLDEKLLLDGIPYTIIGVLPRNFHLPALFEGIGEYKPDIWVPLPAVSSKDNPQLAKARRLGVCARLKPGVTLAQATADMAAIAERRAKDDPEFDRGYGVSVFPLKVENTDPDLRHELTLFTLAAVFVLFLACTSLAGLMLIRTAERARNTAVMAALGAGRWALMGPILCESLILAVTAGIFGFLASFAGIRLIAALKPSDIHAPERLAINWHAFLIAICISVLTALMFGLLPAWLTANSNLSHALKSSPTGSRGQRRAFARSALVAIQIAVSVVLAIAATLLLRSLQRVLAIDPGFRVERVLTAHLGLPPRRYASVQDRARFCQELLRRLRSLPGVDSAALVDNLPMDAIRYTSFEIEGHAISQRSAAPSADDARVTPDFFRAMNIPLRQGRLFTEEDAEMNPAKTVILNETLARQWWPNQNPVGSHIRPLPISGPPGEWQTVVGVVGDFRQFNPETAARPELLWPANALSGMTVVLRASDASPVGFSSVLEKTVWSIDHDQPLSDVQTLGQIVGDHNSQRKFNTLTLGGFASLSIVLMLAGIYGLISSFISAHKRDIGVRFALGAPRGKVCLSLMRPALAPVITGIAAGVALSFLAQKILASVLFQVSPLDPTTYIASAIALLLIMLLTSVAATLRAARIDPASVLRDE
ncbi:MAG TPA: ABC transporter permease [Candidatus Angelobacter sp.]